jgi:hypothetical protein
MDYAGEPGVGIKHKPETANPATARNHKNPRLIVKRRQPAEGYAEVKNFVRQTPLKQPIFCKRFREVELVIYLE